MKFKKENENGFSVNISKKELQALGVRLEELKYGNAATASFLREVLFRARIELDFEPTDEGMRTEIIPKADGGVELIYTFADEFEETDPRYATFCPYIQEMAYKNYYNEDMDNDDLPFSEDTTDPLDDLIDDDNNADLNEVRKTEDLSEDTSSEDPDENDINNDIEAVYMRQLSAEAGGEEPDLEDMIKRIASDDSATASFSIFVDGADITKDATAAQSFDRFMSYLVKGSAGHEFFMPFKNLISKLRNIPTAKEGDMNVAGLAETKPIEPAEASRGAESRDAACPIPATAQEGKKPVPADSKQGRASHGSRPKAGKTAPVNDPPLTRDMIFIFRFDSFDHVCRAAVCAGTFGGANSLYKSPAPESAYYLVMHTLGATAHAVNSTCSIFQEFGKIVGRDNAIFETYAREHYECLIKSDAILHLREIGS